MSQELGGRGPFVMPIQDVRPGAICPLCHCTKADGEHGIYEFDAASMSMVICRPLVLCHTPRYLGRVTGLD